MSTLFQLPAFSRIPIVLPLYSPRVSLFLLRFRAGPPVAGAANVPVTLGPELLDEADVAEELRMVDAMVWPRLKTAPHPVRFRRPPSLQGIFC